MAKVGEFVEWIMFHGLDTIHAGKKPTLTFDKEKLHYLGDNVTHPSHLDVSRYTS